MATSHLAFNDVYMGDPQPRRERHQHLVRKKRSLQGALLRMAAAPLALAIVAGGVIMSQNVEASREVAAPHAFGATLTPRVQTSAAPVLRDTASAPFFEEDHNPDQAAITWARRLPENALSPSVAAFAPDAAPGVLQFGPMRIKRDLVETVVRAARDTDTDPTLLMAIADKESAFAPTVKASTSSATGLFQFIDSTWLRVVRDFGAEFGLEKEAVAIENGGGDIANATERRRILAMRNNPYLSALLAAKMLKHDAARISARIGRELSDGETYLAHFLGPSDAEKFIAKLVSEPHYAAPKLLPKPARANRSIFFGASHRKAKALTVADVHRKFENMMDMRADRYRDVGKLTNVSAYAPTQ